WPLPRRLAPVALSPKLRFGLGDEQRRRDRRERSGTPTYAVPLVHVSHVRQHELGNVEVAAPERGQSVTVAAVLPAVRPAHVAVAVARSCDARRPADNWHRGAVLSGPEHAVAYPIPTPEVRRSRVPLAVSVVPHRPATLGTVRIGGHRRLLCRCAPGRGLTHAPSGGGCACHLRGPPFPAALTAVLPRPGTDRARLSHRV